jgi:hypothetical protein
VENAGQRCDRLRLIPFALKQDAECFQYIALIIRNENPAHFLTAQWPFQPRLKFLVTS